MFLHRKQEKWLKKEITKNTRLIDQITIWWDSRTIKNKTEREEYYYYNCADYGTSKQSDYKFKCWKWLKEGGTWLL